MSQQIINISTPDDGLGDVLRNGFDKTNQNFTELYNGKVDKIAGQGLSENNFTDADKAKLDGIEAGAEVNVQADFLETDPTADSFILNKPPSLYSSVGYFHISNSLTAQSISSGVATDLLNNNLGTYSSSAQAPYGISAIWNTTTNAFDFSQLSLGDMVSLRVDLLIDTTATNQDFRAYITLGIGTASEYKLLLNQSTYKSAVTNYAFLEEVNFSIDNEDWRTAPAKISVLTDASATVLVNGWYVPIIRKSVNVIDVTNDTIYPTESRTIYNRWSLTNLNEYYRSRADYAGFNAETLNNSTMINTINQIVASLSSAFYRTSMSKKISKIYVDGSNIASGITSLKLGVFAFQRATVTDPNFSAVNLINLGEFTLTKTSGVACQSWELTPTSIEIPTNYLVSCVLMKTGGTGIEVNLGIDFKIEDY